MFRWSRSIGLPSRWILACLFGLCVLRSEEAWSKQPSQEPTPVSKVERFVDFQRDMVPLFTLRCLECHQGQDSKGGFDITDRDTVMGYVTARSLSDSMIWTDYLLADPQAEDSQVMPPKNPLTRAELSLVKSWIEEGADWPDAVDWKQPVQVPTVVADHWGARLWAFQGYFHPATVHFPVALIIVAAASVLFSTVTGRRAEDFAVFCLVLGALSAVVAACMGWSFASTRGYPGWSASLSDLQEHQTAFWHRWLGVGVAGLGMMLALIAICVKGRAYPKWNMVWKVGVIVLAALVAWVGHQGGELTYGEQLYHDAFKHITE